MKALLAALISVALSSPTWAATFSVNSTVDAVDATPGNGVCATAGAVCTLRAAIQEHNALGSADVINIPAGTYVLSLAGANEDAAATGDLDIGANGSLEIHGAGAPSTIIDANALDRIFDVKSALSAVTLTDMTIRNGQAVRGGGLVHGSRPLTLLRMMILDSAATDSGGGIGSGGGNVAVTESTVAGNTALYGGGIALANFFNTFTLTNSTVSGNQAQEDGGGIWAESSSATALRNVTVTDNVADSDNNGSGDGGGFADYGDARLMRNSIIAGNFDRGGEAANIFAIFSPAENLFNLTSGDPMLGPLQNNGGPTLTHAPLAGSPAIDTASPAPPGSGGFSCAPTDQRGVARPDGPVCDRGAYEGSPALVCGDGVVDGAEQCDDGNMTSGDGCTACTVDSCFTCGGGPSICTAFCGPGTLDHYKCYAAKDLKMPKFAPVTVDLNDQFVNEPALVQGVKLICNPVDKAGGGINQPSLHLVCYKVKASKLEPRPQIETSNQLQVSRLEVKKSKLLCVPATKTVMP